MFARPDLRSGPLEEARSLCTVHCTLNVLLTGACLQTGAQQEARRMGAGASWRPS